MSVNGKLPEYDTSCSYS